MCSVYPVTADDIGVYVEVCGFAKTPSGLQGRQVLSFGPLAMGLSLKYQVLAALANETSSFRCIR